MYLKYQWHLFVATINYATVSEIHASGPVGRGWSGPAPGLSAPYARFFVAPQDLCLQFYILKKIIWRRKFWRPVQLGVGVVHFSIVLRL